MPKYITARNAVYFLHSDKVSKIISIKILNGRAQTYHDVGHVLADSLPGLFQE